MTPKQQRFVQECLVDLNATQAAIRAGYSKKTARSVGQENLTKPDIAAAITKAMAERAARTQISADQTLRELARIAFADIRTCVQWGPNGVKVRNSNDLSDDDAAAVAEVVETRTRHGRTTRVKLHDKLNALNQIARHLGLFEWKPEQEQVPGLRVVIYERDHPPPPHLLNPTAEELATERASGKRGIRVNFSLLKPTVAPAEGSATHPRAEKGRK